MPTSQSLMSVATNSNLRVFERIKIIKGDDKKISSPEEAKAIAAWAKSKSGLVTFKSEGSDVRPGGWPCGVPVPSLPKPSKDWLEQLKTVEER